LAHSSDITIPPKPCVVCGRAITWRRKWARDWANVRYCSEACRRNPVGSVDERLERAIVTLLAARKAGATICPSEAARAVSADDWRPLMEPARAAARRLAARGEVEITQGGRVVGDASKVAGPIRVRRRGD
jgi:hypothetical protein